MHESLRPETLNRLPPPIRSSAVASISTGKRKPEDIERMQIYAITAPYNERLHLLPALYINIDPSAIPDPKVFDTPTGLPSADVKDLLKRSIVSLETVLMLRLIPNEVCTLVWSRVQLWAEFIDMYRDQLQQIPLIDEGIFCFKFMKLAETLAVDHTTARRIISTPWFWSVIGRAWARLPHVTKTGERDHLRYTLQRFFVVDDRLAEPENFAEFFKGTGGTWLHLSRLIVSFIDEIVPESTTVLDDNLVLYLRSVLSVVSHTNVAVTDRYTKQLAVMYEFRAELLAQGILGALSRAVCCLSRTNHLHSGPVLRDCFNSLKYLIFAPSGVFILPKALDSGLLHALFVSAMSPFASELHQHNEFDLYFTEWFPPALVNYNFLMSLDLAVISPLVVKLLRSSAFKNCVIYETWDKFFAGAKERLDILHEFDGNRESRKACDNLACHKLDSKRTFRRCSGCRCFYYCSLDCQRIDWRDGKHRETCNSYRSLLLSETHQILYTPRQRSFLRFLVHHDHKKWRPQLVSTQTRFMTQTPGAIPIVVYDYTAAGDAQPKVQSVASFDFMVQPEWQNLVCRAAASHGRIRLEVIKIRESTGDFFLVIPLRMNASAAGVYDLMQRTAKKIPKDPPITSMGIIYQKVQDIVAAAADRNVDELH
ncbi:hypothetical protein R3P38DRAFT_3141284 [Favolaschia claudopus]|uniref:MYND-type domain-containing protein n=1 Tax=Favolaschia claudopus TaxID=2862362 RepID=A0AAV9Z573_9AGAR